MSDKKLTFETASIGEEFEHDGYIYIKLCTDDCALVFDDTTNSWKKPKVEH